MLKKTIAVILTILMLASMAVVPSYAAGSQEDIIAESELEDIIEDIVAEFIDASPYAEITVDEDFVEQIQDENGGDVTASELAYSLSKYIFVKYDEETLAALTDEIAEDCIYVFGVSAFGTYTVFIAVDLVKWPQLFNIDVFHDAVIKIIDKQNEYVAEGENDLSLLDYNRAAGELALHMIVYGAVRPFYNLGLRTTIISWLYEHASITDLNIDEDRFPDSLFRVIGIIIMDILSRF